MILDMSGYKFTCAWFDFCFDNPENEIIEECSI